MSRSRLFQTSYERKPIQEKKEGGRGGREGRGARWREGGALRADEERRRERESEKIEKEGGREGGRES